MAQDIIERLNSLLDEERAALLKGDFKQISSLLHKKEALLEQLSEKENRLNLDAPMMAKLRRNLTLYDEALAGLRSVAERIGTTAQSRIELRYYGQDGHTHALNHRGGVGLEKHS